MELNVTELRYRAVLQVQAGTPVVEVAEQCGVSRQAVHRWLRRYRDEGLAGLADRSHRPHGHPAQTPSDVERWCVSCAGCIRGGASGGCVTTRMTYATRDPRRDSIQCGRLGGRPVRASSCEKFALDLA